MAAGNFLEKESTQFQRAAVWFAAVVSFGEHPLRCSSQPNFQRIRNWCSNRRKLGQPIIMFTLIFRRNRKRKRVFLSTTVSFNGREREKILEQLFRSSNHSAKLLFCRRQPITITAGADLYRDIDTRPVTLLRCFLQSFQTSCARRWRCIDSLIDYHWEKLNWSIVYPWLIDFKIIRNFIITDIYYRIFN